jgi:hypothetical protein
MLSLSVRAHVALLLACSDVGRALRSPIPGPLAASTSGTARRARDAGQTTAEYALVLLGAAGIALLLVAWATKSGAVGKLFDLVLGSVMDKVG